jgi:uncharacterized protein
MSGAGRIVARRSPIHGRGVFAVTELPRGGRILEYRGEVISWDEAIARHQAATDAGHTFYFDRGDGSVIDGGRGGNSARWINHGCEPNCETVETDGRVFVHALRPISAGEELLIDYRLAVDDPDDEEVRALYACECGAPSCRRTMLAP